MFLKKVFVVLRKFIFAALLIYGYNVISAPLNLQIPINIITLGLVTILGVPSLIGMILLLTFFFS